MPTSTRVIKLKVNKVLKAYNSKPRTHKWISRKLPNGHIVVIPENDKAWLKKYKNMVRENEDFVNIKEVDHANYVKKQKKLAEKEVLEVVALRAFLRPSKEKFQRHVQPGVPWSTIKHCWSALGKTTNITQYWNPVPGVICEWLQKLKNMIQAYEAAELLNSQELVIKIGIDGTNIWKISMETVSMSFAIAENNLYSNPNAVHLIGLYVGKENRELLGQIMSINDFNQVQQDIELDVNSKLYQIKFYITIWVIAYF